MAESARALNVVQICDHLGWPGSRMHGVKRLFTWMIPRFDAERFNVSLISLRSTDTSQERLEDYGIDVTYLSRSKFDPWTLPALLTELDQRQADIVHMHGYGATTFGRLAAARRGLPTVLHEHANLTDTPWFQKVADRLLAPYTDLAIAVSRSTAEFVTGARQVPRARTRIVYLGAPLEEFTTSRATEQVRKTRASLGLPATGPVVGTVTRLMPAKGNQFPGRSGQAHAGPGSRRAFLHRGRGTAARRPRAAGAASRDRGARPLRRVHARRGGSVRRLRCGRLSFALGRHSPDGLRGARGRTPNRRDRRRRPHGHPARWPRLGHRAQARRRRHRRGRAGAARRSESARRTLRSSPPHRRRLRHHDLRQRRWNGSTE